jgi:hypothetical protein
MVCPYWFYTISFFVCKNNIFFDYKDCLAWKNEDKCKSGWISGVFSELWHWLNAPLLVRLASVLGLLFARLCAVFAFVVALCWCNRNAALQRVGLLHEFTNGSSVGVLCHGAGGVVAQCACEGYDSRHDNGYHNRPCTLVPTHDKIIF